MSARSVDPGRLAHLQRRVVLDALNEATATYWRRRAELLEAARPRAADFTGRASAAELEAADTRCAAAAEACRQRAAVERGHVEAEVLDGGHDMPMCPDACATCLLPAELQLAGVECRPSNAEVT